MSVRNLRDGIITLRDGSPVPKELEIVLDEGDLSFTEREPIFAVKDRGEVDSWSLADEEPTPVSFTIKFQEWTSSHATDVTAPRDALRKAGNAASGMTNEWISTHDDACGPYCVDIVFDILNPCGSGRERIIFESVHCDELTFTEGDEYDTIAVSGQALNARVESTHLAT